MKGTLTSKQRISWLFENGEKFSTASFLALYGKNSESTSRVNHTASIDVTGKTMSSSKRFQEVHETSFMQDRLPTQDSFHGKTAFIAGKKLGNAPLRSRAKRRLREAVRASGESWEAYDVALVARKGALNKDFSHLIADMHRLSAKLEEDTQDPSQTTPHDKRHTSTTKTQDHNPSTSTDNKVLRAIIGIPRTIALLCIKLYRQAISPLLPPSCRYVPTCSEYALIAFERFGFWKGLWLSVKRVGRCHPFAEGGYDPVPEATRHS